jgi:hypothetical protein
MWWEECGVRVRLEDLVDTERYVVVGIVLDIEVSLCEDDFFDVFDLRRRRSHSDGAW